MESDGLHFCGFVIETVWLSQHQKIENLAKCISEYAQKIAPNITTEIYSTRCSIYVWNMYSKKRYFGRLCS